MNLNNIDVNSNKYGLLSKKEKLEVVKLKMKIIFDSDDSNKVYEYYNGKKVAVPKKMAGIFRDLCERERALEKYLKVTKTVEKPTVEVEVMNKNVTDKSINEMNVEELDEKIKYIKGKLYKLVNLYKEDGFKNAKTVVINYDVNTSFTLPYVKLGEYKTLYKYLKTLERRKRELESITLDESNSTSIGDSNKNTKLVCEMSYEELNTAIKKADVGLRDFFNLYKKEKYSNEQIDEVEFRGEKHFIPHSRYDDYELICNYYNSLYEAKSKYEKNNKNYVGYSLCGDNSDAYVNTYTQFISNGTSSNTTDNIIYPNLTMNSTFTEDLVNNNTITGKSNKKKKGSIKEKIKKGINSLILISSVRKIKEKVTKTYKSIKSKVKNINKKNSSSVGNIKDRQTKKKLRNRFVAFTLAAFTTICCFLPKNNSKKNDMKNDSKRTSIVQEIENNNYNEDIIIDESKNEINNNDNRGNNEIISENTNITSDYTIGDNICFENNSSIYTNSYDATSGTNSYKPLYDSSYEREIVGVTYELDGNLYTIYKYDIKANEKIDELVAKGAKQTAVLVVRSDLIYTNDYEGYYNVDSVKKLTRNR